MEPECREHRAQFGVLSSALIRSSRANRGSRSREKPGGESEEFACPIASVRLRYALADRQLERPVQSVNQDQNNNCRNQPANGCVEQPQNQNLAPSTFPTFRPGWNRWSANRNSCYLHPPSRLSGRAKCETRARHNPQAGTILE